MTGRPVICAACKAAGKTSRVEEHGGTTTDMYCPPFYDEKGVRHHHDYNAITTSFSCSNGHSWVEQRNATCPACDWPEGDT